ncbi:DUF3857 domain-containing protein [Arcticibacter sp. MXS-1]|uniref:DUF3857 domain-containing protein n=1 Tax=Arcticibacter sp. MXS-1 TaxID=3341726 RepID=UPI0035A82F46
MPYGKISTADLELKECPFEKDANAMVLFDKADVYFDQNFDIVMERHKRVKIFNEKAKDAANVRLEYYSINHYEELYGLQAQTINLKDGKTVITKLDKKQIFTEAVDKNQTALVFSFPDVQPGSIIEFKYQWKTGSFSNFPDWEFQSDIPVRYSELTTSVPDLIYYKPQYRIHQPFFKNKTSSESKSLGTGTESVGYTVDIRTQALQNVPSLSNEPYMTSRRDNIESVQFQLAQIKPIGGFVKSYADTWQKVVNGLTEDEDFGSQLKKKLQGEELLVAKAKSLKTTEEKIAYLFNEVRNTMKWNGVDRWYTNDGISKAWQKKTGNSTEINLILYRLLHQADVKEACPMIVSTRSHGKINIAYPWLYQFNRTVVHIPVDSTKMFVLDACSKYQPYNTIPDHLLNSYGLSVDKDSKKYDFVELNAPEAARKNVFITAQIKADGKVSGNANIYDFDYHKISSAQLFKTDGEEKFKEWLTEKDNAIKINNMKLEGVDIDSLPMKELFDFEMELKGVDGDYIYFNPNLFSSLRKNPFLAEKRTTIIDFGHPSKYTITGTYEIPEHFKADALPKSLNLVMPDKSISFKRIVNEEDGRIMIRYVIDFQKSIYVQDEYPLLRQFYKQMFDMLNEQIVLKKS